MSFEEKHKLESAFFQRDPENGVYHQINITGSDLIVYHSSSGELTADKISEWIKKYNIGGDATESESASYMFFDGDRPITRTPHVGINVETDTVVDFLERFFFPFIGATITINDGITYYEQGTSQNVSVFGNIIAGTENVFGDGRVTRTGTTFYTFPSASSYSTIDSNMTSNQMYQAYMEVGNNGSPTEIYSSIKTISFIYPYLYGMSTTSGLSGTNLYSEMNKLIQIQGVKSVNLVGVSTYIYFCFPDNYSDLISIKDPSNFEVLTSFDYFPSVSVTSVGLSSDWTRNYKVYRLKLQADPNGVFTFYHA
jgi:hypothetical protein